MGTGCVVGDYDNEGWPDLHVINVGAVGSHNNHNRTFTDVAVQAGVALDEGLADVAIDHTGATFGDYDGDGNLDLFVDCPMICTSEIVSVAQLSS